MADVPGQVVQPGGGAEDNEVFQLLDTQEYAQELELCRAAGADTDKLRSGKFDLYQLTEIRKGLQSGVNVSRYMSSSIPWMQMEELRLEMEQNVDMSRYRKNGFGLPQIAEIREGLAAGLDVSEYDKKDYFAEQMKEIRLGLKAGVPVVFYRDPQYDWMQMAEIRKGLETNMDISLYAQIELPYLKMRAVRESLADGLVFTKEQIAICSAGVLEQMHQAYLEKTDIRPYVERGYDADQLEQVRIALSEKLDPDRYMLPEMRGESMREIRIGLEEGIDVSQYANPEYNWQQMRELRKGLENRVDISLFSKPLYLSQQMREIRKGLEANLDVSRYSSMINTAADMRVIRKKLEAGEEVPMPAVSDYTEPREETETENHQLMFELPVSRKKTAEENKEAVPQEHYLKLSEDGLNCYLRLPKPAQGKSITLDFILAILAKAGVVKGVNRQTLSSMILEEKYETDVLIAEGKEAETGTDGYYEFFFDREVPSAPAIVEEGAIDFQKVKIFEKVNVGDRLAEYHKATSGSDGYTVTGKVLPGKNGKEMSILKGRGFLLLSDNTYCAAVSGVVKLSGNELNINRLMVLDGVHAKDGVIDFGGSIWVKGEIGSGSEIHALGDVVIDGYSDNAVVIAGGDAFFRQGAGGTAHSRIDAGGQVAGKYFQGMEIRAGRGLLTNSCINCKIYSEGSVVCCGVNGTVFGGEVQTLQGLKTAILGNEQKTRTVVNLGVTTELQTRYNEIGKQITKVHSELEIFGKERKRLASMNMITREQLQWKIKINVASGMKEKELATLEHEKEVIEEKIRRVSGASAMVSRIVYAGTILMIDGVVMSIATTREEKNGIVFRKDKKAVNAVKM